MNLKDAQLCIDCEWIYALANSCPRCGSAVSFPVARALDHEVHSVAHLARPLPVPSPVTASQRPALVPSNTIAVAAMPEPQPLRGKFTSLLRSA